MNGDFNFQLLWIKCCLDLKSLFLLAQRRKLRALHNFFVSSLGIFYMSPIQALLKSKCFSMVHAQVVLQGTLSLHEAPGFHIWGMERSFFIVWKFKSIRHICKCASCLCLHQWTDKKLTYLTQHTEYSAFENVA